MKKQLILIIIICIIICIISYTTYLFLDNSNNNFKVEDSFITKLNFTNSELTSNKLIVEKIKWANILKNQDKKELSNKVISKIDYDLEIMKKFDSQPTKYNIEKIEIIQTKTKGIWTAELYRNYAYPCSLEGYQTFVLAYKNEITKEKPHPLIIRLHGGGIGSYFSDQTYYPSEYYPSLISEESFEYFDEIIQEEGLMEKILNNSKNFRILIPSMCNHDAYSGIGTLDVYNPNLNSNGELKNVNGLLSTRAALEFTKQNVNNTHIFVHGLSAGGVGAMSLITSLGQEGEGLTGAILDSAIFFPYGAKILEQQCSNFNPNFQTILNRIGYFFEKENQPGNNIERGIVLTPIYNVWVNNDQRWSCGNKIITIENEGIKITQEGNWFQQHSLNNAIEKYNPKNVSEFRELCVNNNETILASPECSKHTPTKYNAGKLGGDKFHNNEDYNKVIFKWIKERLNEPY